MNSDDFHPDAAHEANDAVDYDGEKQIGLGGWVAVQQVALAGVGGAQPVGVLRAEQVQVTMGASHDGGRSLCLPQHAKQ